MHVGLAYVGLPLAQADLLGHLNFLADKGLIRLDYRDEFKVWVIDLTRTGREVVRGLVEVEGIERPQGED
ncbi:hypothetical protein GCM10027084_02180 [Pseudoxanthomonas sangjuensis]|uniref:hypothetical protein n=1 Tax=Pseudoxanthomonas sangjuensis TaxID=1503750 RepID=UPI001390CA70|nr:hypothetical protein [Pseudoxanthomonas sangjuensis]